MVSKVVVSLRGLIVSILALSCLSARAAGVLTSNLPLILITTDAAINAGAKVAGTMKVINQPEGLNSETDAPTDYDGRIGIKLRGNSSLSFAQKKYTLETWDQEGNDLEVPLLGMSAGSDWVLLAPYNDISLVRDVFAFNMWTEMGHWAPRTQMCEVKVNGEYQGVYIFCEKIKRGKDRVDIAKLKQDDVEGRELTGGYIVRVDAFDDEDATFASKVKGIPDNGGGGWPWGGGQNTTVTWTVYHPKKAKLQPQQMAYIHDFIDRVEQSFQQADWKDPEQGYARYVDVPSFVDYFIHTELSLNADGFKRSSYFYKDKDAADGTEARLVAGPVWDYNLAYGDCNFCNANNVKAWVYEGCTTNPTPAFWKRLTTDPAFMQAVRERYAQLRQTVISQESINAFFDSYAQLLDEAKDRHYAKYNDLLVDSSQQQGGGWPWWPWGGGSTSPVAYFAAYFVASYAEEIQTVKDWFAQRLAFLDSQWGYDASSAVSAPQGYVGLDVQVPCPDSQTMSLRLRADRPLRRVEVVSLDGKTLAKTYGAQLDTGGADTSCSVTLTCRRRPCVVVCHAADGSYITRKIM